MTVNARPGLHPAPAAAASKLSPAAASAQASPLSPLPQTPTVPSASSATTETFMPDVLLEPPAPFKPPAFASPSSAAASPSASSPPAPSSPTPSAPPLSAMPRPALRAALPALLRSTLPAALRSALGGFAAILLCASLGSLSHIALLMAPFGATCVLAFALPDSPLAQPRNIIGGHTLSTAIGLFALNAFGSHAWSLALAVGLAIAAMQLTRTVHPPAGADPLLVMLSGAGWGFLLTPVLTGAVLIVAVAWLYHRLASGSSTGRRYPKQWR